MEVEVEVDWKPILQEHVGGHHAFCSLLPVVPLSLDLTFVIAYLVDLSKLYCLRCAAVIAAWYMPCWNPRTQKCTLIEFDG